MSYIQVSSYLGTCSIIVCLFYEWNGSESNLRLFYVGQRSLWKWNEGNE